MKSAIDIIRETIDFYDVDVNRRAVHQEECVYETHDGRHCAFSRCCTVEGVEMLSAHANEGSGVISACMNLAHNGYIKNELDVDALLQPEYRGHGIDFWGSIQGLHDNIEYWDEDGVTRAGRAKARNLIKLYEGRDNV